MDRCFLILLAGVVLLALQTMIFFGWLEESLSYTLSNSLPALAAALVVVSTLQIKTNKGKDFWRYIRYSFMLMFLGELSWAVHTLIYGIDPSEVLTITDLFYLLSYLPLIYALLKFWKRHELMLSQGEVTLVFLIITLISSVSVTLLFQDGRDIIDTIYLSYPMLDLIVLGMMPLIFRLIAKVNRITLPYILLNLGYVLFFAADFSYNYLVWKGVPIASSDLVDGVDLIYILAYFITTLGACSKLWNIEYLKNISNVSFK